MKLLLVTSVCLQLVFINCLTIPDYIPPRCKASDPKYSTCLQQTLEKARTYFVKGVPEMNIPPLDPLVVPYMTVNRTINELVSINAVLKNIRIVGFANTIIEKAKGNPKAMAGELSITVPHFQMEMEYDVTGQLLIIPLRSKGYFRGNFTNTQFNMKLNMKRVEQNEEEYFQIDKMSLKSRVDDGVVKLLAKNQQLQFAADLIANFYNENPRLVMDAINPIYVQHSKEFFQDEMNKALITLPAKELLPE